MARRMLTGADMNNQRIINVADPTDATDAVNLQTLNNAIAGLSFKNEVRVATTTNGTLATAYENGDTIDGVTLVTGDRILLKNQTDESENGIYNVAASGAPTRATDADDAEELNNATVLVTEGTVNEGRMYTQTTIDPDVGTDDIVWAQFTTGTAYTEGNGIDITGDVITAVAKAGGSLAVDSDGIYIDPTGPLAKLKYATNVPTSNPATITHSLGTKDVIVQVFEVATDIEVDCDVTRTSTSVVTLGFDTTPGSGEYRCVVMA